MTLMTQRGKTNAYIATIGNPHKRKIFAEALYKDLEQAESKGNEKWANFIRRELISIGEGDYLPEDSGNDHLGYNGEKYD
jgi:hypothetical protein